jgi:hypothetical protein
MCVCVMHVYVSVFCKYDRPVYMKIHTHTHRPCGTSLYKCRKTLSTSLHIHTPITAYGLLRLISSQFVSYVYMYTYIHTYIKDPHVLAVTISSLRWTDRQTDRHNARTHKITHTHKIRTTIQWAHTHNCLICFSFCWFTHTHIYACI